MVKNERAYPQFSMCGLNCGLCPMYHAYGNPVGDKTDNSTDQRAD